MISLQSGFYHSREAVHKPMAEPPVRELRDVSVAFRSGDGVRTVLRDLQLTLSAGEWVALVGRNGSGKSTLARVLAGLLPVSKGEMISRGRAAIVFQQPEAQIIGETVYEDVSFGLENLAVPTEQMPGRVQAALTAVGLDKPAEAPVHPLSGGQKQLLAVAGNLVLEPALLVFDEATSMLDPSSRHRLLHLSRRLAQEGACIVWVTQWMEELAFADRVVALADGTVVFDGPPDAFFYEGACEALGFDPPYAVRAALALAQAGIDLGRVLTVEALTEAIARAVTCGVAACGADAASGSREGCR